MLNKFKTIFDSIVSERGDVNLFAVLKMDDLTEKWSIFVCAPWANETNREEVFNYILDKIKAGMTREEVGTLARIVITNMEDHLTNELMRYRASERIGGGGESIKINGNMVHDAHIIASNRDLV